MSISHTNIFTAGVCLCIARPLASDWVSTSVVGKPAGTHVLYKDQSRLSIFLPETREFIRQPCWYTTHVLFKDQSGPLMYYIKNWSCAVQRSPESLNCEFFIDFVDLHIHNMLEAYLGISIIKPFSFFKGLVSGRQPAPDIVLITQRICQIFYSSESPKFFNFTREKLVNRDIFGQKI